MPDLVIISFLRIVSELVQLSGPDVISAPGRNLSKFAPVQLGTAIRGETNKRIRAKTFQPGYG